MRQRLGCGQFAARHRRRAQDFSRRRDLGFARVMLFVLQKGARSLAGRLADFFERLARWEPGGVPATPSASAWTQARAKLSHTAFVELNQEAVLEVFYAPHNPAQARAWLGHRLVAIDGSVIALPATKQEVGAHFGWVEPANQHGACGGRQARALASVCFDVLNELGLDARLEPWRTPERVLGALHLGALRAGDVVLTDRGYFGQAWLGAVRAAGADFVCRVPRHCLKQADALFLREEPGAQSRVALGPAGLAVRLVALRLSTGELEVLATSLLDEARYPLQALGEAYGLRWGIETYYARLKGPPGAGALLRGKPGGGAPGLLWQPVSEQRADHPGRARQAHLSRGDAQRRLPARLNRAQGFHALKSQALDLFLSPLPIPEVLARLTRLMGAAPVAQRKGRRVERLPPSANRSLAFLRYRRKHPF